MSRLWSAFSLANMLAELREYRLILILAHQYLGQVDEPITRIKGLGEISPKEFAQFIGKEMRLSKVEYAP